MSIETETQSKRLQCVAVKADGTRCTAPAVFNGFCVGHMAGSNENRAKGGKNRATKARMDKKLPLRIRHIVILLEKALIEVHERQISTQQGSAMASLGGAIVKAYESGILEERLTALEKKIGADNATK